MLKGENFKYVAIMLLAGLTIIGRQVHIHQGLQVLLHTVLLVYLGCVFSAKLFDVKKEREVEVMQQKDAWMFPVFGSGVLFGLFLVFRYLNKDYVNILFHYYFSFIGAYSVGMLIYERLVDIPTFEKMSKKNIFTVPAIKFLSDKPTQIDLLYIITLILGSVVGVAYFLFKNWTLNNILGNTFSVFGIENIMLGQFKVGFILLCLLFFYDIFWVFGTPVMVEVAKNLDGPIKLMFPKHIPLETVKDFNMIGLGDIVIPGIYVALMLRYDMMRYMKSHPGTVNVPFTISNFKYFLSTMLGYTLGMLATLGIMFFFQAAQPALLYLVPGCLISSLLVAVISGDLKGLWEFNEEQFLNELKGEEKKQD
jgi:minor histocompatibility antigen H13